MPLYILDQTDDGVIIRLAAEPHEESAANRLAGAVYDALMNHVSRMLRMRVRNGSSERPVVAVDRVYRVRSARPTTIADDNEGR